MVKPVTVAKYTPTVHLTPQERQLLSTAREKITKIQEDLVSAVGLTSEEVRVAIKAGLIDPEQAWWWLESWQQKEREAEKDIRAGRVKEFESVEDLIKDLRS